MAASTETNGHNNHPNNQHDHYQRAKLRSRHLILDRAIGAFQRRCQRENFIFDQPARDCCYWWGELCECWLQLSAASDPKGISGRFKDGGAHEAVETEALRQQIIIEILRNQLDELLPEPLSTVQERADKQRARLRAV
jgi:hypothetical protein